jgi:hypothetical protein
MPTHWIDLQNCQSLAVLVETVAAPLLIHSAAAYCLESDIDAKLKVPGDPSICGLLIESLVRAAIFEMPAGGDLYVSACQTARGLELEISDHGSDVEKRSQTRPLMAAKLGATLQWKNCPQGGGSVTVLFPNAATQGTSINQRKAA